MAFLPLLIRGLSLAGLAAAQFPPSVQPMTTVSSKLGEGVTLEYKKQHLCETTPGVDQYTGYVNLPEHSLESVGVTQRYPVHTFWWFVESRNDPSNAPLTIILDGGPGASSLSIMLQDNGPCRVASDSNSTFLNPWSWNEVSNVLFVDQPVQAGFSYDVLTNCTNDLNESDIEPLDDGEAVSKQNNTFLVGTFGTQDRHQTFNSTGNSARAFWYFTQVWLETFPECKSSNSKVGLWTQSYGGKYGPAFYAFMADQNEKIQKGTIGNAVAREIHLDTVGIMNGCIDDAVQNPTFADFAMNNTYGIKLYNETIYQLAVERDRKPGGCLDQIQHCRNISRALSDDAETGAIAAVNKACAAADKSCDDNIGEGVFAKKYGHRSLVDITQRPESPTPPEWWIGYLNQPHVQRALNVPVNFTGASDAIFAAFVATGDYPRAGLLEDLGRLLDDGIKVALVYGDRYYSCNWFGGEAASLAVRYRHAQDFAAAGYAEVRTNASYVGGLVRQHGNFSFTRVFQSGHEVPAYQPETALRIFERVQQGKDVATGEVDATAGYASTGPAEVRSVKSEVPPLLAPVCYILDQSTCTKKQIKAINDGTAAIKDWVVLSG